MITHHHPAECPQPVPRACGQLDALAEALGPLITELAAMAAHTRDLAGLAQRERRPQEYQLAAQTIVQALVEGWRLQTDGAGTVQELLAVSVGTSPGCHIRSHSQDHGET